MHRLRRRDRHGRQPLIKKAALAIERAGAGDVPDRVPASGGQISPLHLIGLEAEHQMHGQNEEGDRQLRDRDQRCEAQDSAERQHVAEHAEPHAMRHQPQRR